MNKKHLTALVVAILSHSAMAQEQDGMCYYVYDRQGQLESASEQSPFGLVWPPIHEGVAISQVFNGRNVVARRDQCARAVRVAAVQSTISKQATRKIQQTTNRKPAEEPVIAQTESFEHQKLRLEISLLAAQTAYTLPVKFSGYPRDAALTSIKKLGDIQRDIQSDISDACLMTPANMLIKTINVIKQATASGVTSASIAESMRDTILGGFDSISREIMLCDR